MSEISKLNRLTEKKFKKFSVNKKREITRLVWEIFKRDKIYPCGLLSKIENLKFSKAKSELLKIRYPQIFSKVRLESFYLPKLEIDPANKANIRADKFYPKNIYIEKSVSNSALSRRTLDFFPKARLNIITSLKEFSKTGTFGISDYNKRTDNLFLIRENFDFIKPCPCTGGVLNCGYNILNMGFGCPYECVYCFLPGYQNVAGIVLPANIGDYFKKLKTENLRKGIFNRPRIGTGEFTDSLVFDSFTHYCKEIITHMRRFKEVDFEFKTKSVNIENILGCKPGGNIVVSWSVNPAGIADKTEFLVPSLPKRLKAAKKLSEAGFRIGFHFDPVIYHKNWQMQYETLINNIFSEIDGKNIAWISIGSFRSEPGLKKIIENRFPQNFILDEELILDFDGKLRYFRALRIKLYKTLVDCMRQKSKKVKIYLCMEPADVWHKSGVL